MKPDEKYHSAVEAQAVAAIKASFGDWDEFAGPIFSHAVSYINDLAQSDEDGPISIHPNNYGGIRVSFAVFDENIENVLNYEADFADIVSNVIAGYDGCYRSEADAIAALEAEVLAWRKSFTERYKFEPELAEKKFSEGRGSA